MWRDTSLVPREVDKASGTIFDVIMPWVKEQELEEEKKKNDLKKERAKSQSDQKTKLKQNKTSDPGKLDKLDQLRYLSKVVVHPNVEEFDWRFEDKNLLKPDERPKIR